LNKFDFGEHYLKNSINLNINLMYILLNLESKNGTIINSNEKFFKNKPRI